MAEAKVGDAFIGHEFDDAIAIRQRIVEAEQRRGRWHPLAEAETLASAEAAESAADKAHAVPPGPSGI